MLIGLFLVAVAGASPVALPSQAELKARNIEIVSKVDGAPGVFSVQEDGTIRHLQSRMICPADFLNVHLMDLQIFKSEVRGDDVGCDYARREANGLTVSKLTIFATRAPAGLTLDAVFADHKRAIAQAYPGAVEMPASLQIEGPTTGNADPGYRATGYTVSIGGIARHTELISAIEGSWIVEIRATYPSAVITVEKGVTEKELVEKLYDIKSPYLALLSVSKTLEAGGPTP